MNFKVCPTSSVHLSSMQICDVIVLGVVKSALSVQPFLRFSSLLILSVSLMWSLVLTLKYSFRRKNANRSSPEIRLVKVSDKLFDVSCFKF